MKPIAVAFVAVLAITLAPACDWINRVDPTIKPLPGHLCSEVEVECYAPGTPDGTGKPDGCCSQGQVCGGAFPTVGCPDPNECCDVGNEIGASRHTPKRRPDVSQ
jgi:hypothetical protein